MSNHSSELVEISKLNGDFNRGRHPARVNAQDPSLSQPAAAFSYPPGAGFCLTPSLQGVYGPPLSTDPLCLI